MRGWLLTFHLVGAVLWTGGLFVLTRLLSYHAGEPPSARPTLSRIESRLGWLWVIPAALLSIGSGGWLVSGLGVDWLRVSLWMQAKLALVGVLLFVHGSALLAMRRVARRDPNEAISRAPWRALSVMVVILLVAVIALSVQRPWIGGGK